MREYNDSFSYYYDGEPLYDEINDKAAEAAAAAAAADVKVGGAADRQKKLPTKITVEMALEILNKYEAALA